VANSPTWRAKWLVESDRLVVDRGRCRVEVLRPAQIADVATDHAGDATLLVADRNEDALAVDVGETLLASSPACEPRVDELVVGDTGTAQRGDEAVRAHRAVTDLKASRHGLGHRHLDAAAREIRDAAVMKRSTAVVAPRESKHGMDTSPRCPPEVRTLEAWVLEHGLSHPEMPELATGRGAHLGGVRVGSTLRG